MSPLYQDEFATADFVPLFKAMTTPKFANYMSGVPDYLWEEEYHKALGSLPWKRFEPQFAEAWSRGIEKCESPIEKMLLPWLLQAQYQFFDYNPTVLLPGETDKYVPGTIAVIPQLPIGKYRADFALAGSLGKGPVRFVIVECDGKEFHDGVDNVKRDVDRDASILANKRVLDVVRLEGSWIMRNAQQAAWSAAKRLLGAWSAK